MANNETGRTQDATRRLVPALLSWFISNARDLPWRRTRDPYAIWVSEIMLQQTQVRTVIPYWVRWMRELPTIRAAAKASPARLHKLWEGLGYYTRVRNLQRAAKEIIAQHDGKFPTGFDNVLSLPGIGRYTAGAICSIAFNQPTPILDGNVIRVLARVFGINGDPREKKTKSRLWEHADELVKYASRVQHHAPRTNSSARRSAKNDQNCCHLNQSLMELGALVCTPRSPDCPTCPVRKLCVARKEKMQDRLPKLGRRKTTTGRCFVAFIVESNGKFLVRQRPAGVVNAHLWEFPNLEIGARFFGPQNLQSAARTVGLQPAGSEPLGVIKHSITRYSITLEVWRAKRVNPLTRQTPGRWLTTAQLNRLAFASAHKKILSRLHKNH